MKSAKIRVYYPFFPYPPTEGSFYVAFDQVRTLSKLGHRVELICWKNTLEEVEVQRQRNYIEPFPEEVKVIAPQNGPASKETAWQRLFRVGQSLVSEFSSPEIYYYPVGKELPLEEEVDVAIYNYGFCFPWLRKNESSLREKKRIVVFHNLESELFEDRAAQAKNIVARWIHQKNFQKLLKHELAIPRMVDEIWWISPEDQRGFQKRGGDHSKSRLVTPGFSREFGERRKKNFLNQRRKSTLHTEAIRAETIRPETILAETILNGPVRGGVVLGFVGSLDFLPNQMSVRWLIQKMAPGLKKRGFQGELWIVGKGCPKELRDQAREYPFIHFEGFLADLEEFWAKLDFSLVPHISGSGVRIKLLESLATGVPTLATSAAASRIDPQLLKSSLLCVSDDAEQWCDFVMKEDAAKLRERWTDLPLHPVLDSIKIYSFLNERE